MSRGNLRPVIVIALALSWLATAALVSAESKPTLTERNAVSTIVLTKTSPPMEISEGQRTIAVERSVFVRRKGVGRLLGRNRDSDAWTSEFTGTGTVRASSGQIQFGLGLVPTSLISTDPASPKGRQVLSTPLGLGLVVTNLSDSSLQIDWDAVNVVLDGRAVPIIHRGVRMEERDRQLATSTIPPGVVLHDFVYPRGSIRLETVSSTGVWKGDHVFEAMRPGQAFTLSLPVKRGGGLTEYRFFFDVHEPSHVPLPIPAAPRSWTTVLASMTQFAEPLRRVGFGWVVSGIALSVLIASVVLFARSNRRP